MASCSLESGSQSTRERGVYSSPLYQIIYVKGLANTNSKGSTQLLTLIDDGFINKTATVAEKRLESHNGGVREGLKSIQARRNALAPSPPPSKAGQIMPDVYLIIIAFKGAIRDFFTISSLRREPSPARTLNRVQIICNASSASHVQHVALCATWYEGTAQLLSLSKLQSHLFELYFTASTIHR